MSNNEQKKESDLILKYIQINLVDSNILLNFVA